MTLSFAKNLLNVNKEDSYKQAYSKYRHRIKKAHPDKGGSQAHFIEVQQAWEMLKPMIDSERKDKDGLPLVYLVPTWSLVKSSTKADFVRYLLIYYSHDGEKSYSNYWVDYKEIAVDAYAMDMGTEWVKHIKSVTDIKPEEWEPLVVGKNCNIKIMTHREYYEQFLKHSDVTHVWKLNRETDDE